MCVQSFLETAKKRNRYDRTEVSRDYVATLLSINEITLLELLITYDSKKTCLSPLCIISTE